MKKIILLFLLIIYSFSTFSQKSMVFDLTIKGAKKTKLSEIQKIIETKKTTTLDSIILKNDIIRLKRLPAISHAYFQVFHSHKNQYKVSIIIEENFTLIPEFNLWTTTNNKTAYKLGLYDHNFLGRNIAFGGFYQNNGFNSYGINFKAPTLFSKNWGINLTYQDWQSEEPLYFGGQTASYRYQNTSFEVLSITSNQFQK